MLRPIVLVLVAAVVVAAGCGGSSRPKGSTTITALAYLPPGGGPITGTFRATGVIVDSGTLFDTFKVLSSTMDSSRASVERTLYSVRGTIKFHFVLTETRGRASGRWEIQSGTGRYAHVRGSGTYSGQIDFLPKGAEKIRDTMTGAVR